MDAPITELSNEITAAIDLAGPGGIVRLLQQCDSQIFTGWRQHQSLYDTLTLRTITDIATAASSVIKDDDGGCIVLSGCGTSGRIAFLTACTFNKILSAQGWWPCFTYTIAGGDRALLLSTEAPEDSCAEGVATLKQSIAGKNKVLYVGISCGLSAPFVAGQLQHCLDHPNQFTPVLVGFNPVHMARKTQIVNWDWTFYDVVCEMEKRSDNCFILNPVVGPEPITGSSRMKGGSATKLLLETVFTLAVDMLHTTVPIQLSAAQRLLMGYELTYRAAYLSTDSIAQLVEAAGKTLCSGGRLCYLGVSRFGCLSLVDASECPPTYGAAYDDIRGFLLEGWAGMGNNEGQLSQRGMEYHISWDEFEAEVLPGLSQTDLVVLVMSEDNLKLPQVTAIRQKVLAQCRRLGSVTVCSNYEQDSHSCSDLSVSISLPSSSLLGLIQPALPHLPSSFMLELYSEIAVKWALNAITTGAHVLKGKVLKNYMVDLQVSNTKLYHRAVGIIQEFTGVERDCAEDKLLSVIYCTDQLTPAVRASGIVSHIEKATGMAKVVPTAILLAKGYSSLTAACETLAKTPIVRQALQK